MAVCYNLCIINTVYDSIFSLIYFCYGLAFFSMGFAILLELGHGKDIRLRHSLRPLAAFGLLHGVHEWMEMFSNLGILSGEPKARLVWEGSRLAILAFSFLSLGAFGSSLLAEDERARRLSLLLPLSLAGIWGIGLYIMRGLYAPGDMIVVADVWTRYILAVPSSLFACAGLVIQQRRFRQAGMAQFGRDALWAAIAFFWYGIIGQTFTRASALPPSNVINQGLFTEVFGFPVELLRAGAATLAAIFVMRFLRSFEVELNNQIAALQTARLQEAERREALRGELLKRVVEAQEAERQRIGRELHDETGQSLTAIGLGLRGTSETFKQDPVKAAQQLHQLERLTAQSLEELQRLIANLRPSHLDDLGLGAALRWYSSEIQKRTPININVEISGNAQQLPSEVKTALFRIAQEALTNTVKHAQAKNVQVSLIFGDGQVTVQVSDDGCGFNEAQPSPSGRVSFGLEGMRERATLLGGVCHIYSEPRQGTLVEVTIPYQGSEGEAVE
jgi:signal transduction histidine kinase